MNSLCRFWRYQIDRPLVNDLEAAGYLTKIRDGRRNRYEVHDEMPLRHPQHSHHTVGELIRFLEAPAEPAAGEARSHE